MFIINAGLTICALIKLSSNLTATTQSSRTDHIFIEYFKERWTGKGEKSHVKEMESTLGAVARVVGQ